MTNLVKSLGCMHLVCSYGCPANIRGHFTHRELEGYVTVGDTSSGFDPGCSAAYEGIMMSSRGKYKREPDEHM